VVDAVLLAWCCCAGAADVAKLLKDRKKCSSARETVLISGNWLLFIWRSAGRLLERDGYFINRW